MLVLPAKRTLLYLLVKTVIAGRVPGAKAFNAKAPHQAISIQYLY